MYNIKCFIGFCILFNGSLFLGASEKKGNPAEILNYEQNIIPMKTTGYYAVFLPKDYHTDTTKFYPVCVILHGSGSNEVSHGLGAETLGREEIIYVAPRAPYPHEEVFLEYQKPGWTAWPNYPEEWGNRQDSTFPSSKLEGINSALMYLEHINNAVLDVRNKYRTDGKKVAVFGHSQGATFAQDYAVRYPQMVKAFFAYAGYYDFMVKNDSAAKSISNSGVVPFISHSKLDKVVESKQSENLISYYKKHKVKVLSKIYEKGSHFITDEVYQDARSFIQQQLLDKKAAPLKKEMLVIRVVKNSEADIIGLKIGDVIKKYGHKVIEASKDLDEVKVDSTQPDTVNMVVVRSGKELNFKIKRGPVGIGSLIR